MSCEQCSTSLDPTCQVCTHSEVDPTETSIYKERVKPLMFVCATILVLSYLIGLWFTLRTHAALVYHSQAPRHQSIYQRLVPINIIQQLLPNSYSHHHNSNLPDNQNLAPPPLPRPMSAPVVPGVPSIQNILLHNENTLNLSNSLHNPQTPSFTRQNTYEYEVEEEVHGHDSPNWSNFKSGIVLVSCTLCYSFIAETLVDNVKFVLEHVTITEKVLGLTLFALVPNVTEFLNATLFALYGNIALSMEIGSAYALQVCLLQIPAMVAYSAWMNRNKSDEETSGHTFTLIFPRWDVFAVVFSVFLLTYTYIEGKSNYFKGSVLILSYLVLMAGFFYAPDSTYDSYNM